jgi:uncharacterized membrane protein (UPF0127 family)
VDSGEEILMEPTPPRVISPERVLLTICALAAAWCVADFARFGLAMRYCMDDWEWLGRSTRMTELILQQFSFRMEVFRPLPQYLYALSYKLFGLRTGPFAALLVSSHLVAAWAAARVVRSLGYTTLSAAVVALLALLDPVSAESLQFFSLNQPVLSRAFMLLSLAALLERDPPPRRAWLPWAVLGILTHEQATLLAPLWVLCLLHRDGVTKTLAAVRTRHGATVLALCFGYLALRFALRHSDPNLPHALSLRAVPQKWARVIGHLRGFVAVHTGFGTAPGNFPREGYLDHKLSAVHAVAAGAWLVVVGAWAALRPAHAGRTALTSALWVLGGYAPYFLAINESPNYHFNLSLIGLALLPGAAMGELWTLCEGRARPARLALAALGLVTVLPFGRRYLQPGPLNAARSIIDQLRPRVRAAPDRVSNLIFLDDVSHRGYGGAPLYLAQMSGEFSFNRVDQNSGERNWALALSFPHHRVRVWVLSTAHGPYLCPREDDLVLHVSAPPNDSFALRFAPVATCTRPGGLPPALDPTAPEGAALASLAPWSTSAAPELLRRYWAAYAARDGGAQRASASALLALARGFESVPGLRSRAALALDAVRATMPPSAVAWTAPGSSPSARGVVRLRSSRGGSATIPVEAATSQSAINDASERARPVSAERGLALMYGRVEPHVFATRSTRIPIDIVYVHENGHEILATVPRAAPGRVFAPPSRAPSSSVLLLPAGFLASHDLRPGDAVSIELDP